MDGYGRYGSTWVGRVVEAVRMDVRRSRVREARGIRVRCRWVDYLGLGRDGTGRGGMRWDRYTAVGI